MKEGEEQELKRRLREAEESNSKNFADAEFYKWMLYVGLLVGFTILLTLFG